VANVWNERKGFQYFLELSNLINSDEIVVLVGLSKKEINKLPKNIIGITRTNSIRELADIYSSADVFVNSTLEEVMGLTNVEALACGTPVITFNSGGSPECIDESCGLVVEKGNIEKLQQAISLFKAKGKAFYSINCINRAHAYFNSSDRNSDYLNLYRSLVLSVSK